MNRKPEAEMKRTKGKVTNTTALPPSELLRLMMKHGSSSAIEGMEADGQQELVAANGASLPIAGSELPCFAKMGIVFGPALDPVFREATLPLDWSIHANPSHSMWSAILDAQGRTRATIFYKAAFYDRHAELHPTARYTVEVEYQGEFGKTGESHRAFVFDNATHQEILSSKTLRRDSPSDRTFLKTEDLRKEVTEWLVQRFPEFKDPTAYWD